MFRPSDVPGYLVRHGASKRKLPEFEAHERYELTVGYNTVMKFPSLERALEMSRPLVALWKMSVKMSHVKVIDRLTGECTILIH